MTVLEARGRVGGRVHTLRGGFAAGQHAEGGGEYIDTRHRAMRALARELGLQLEDVRVGTANFDDVVYLHGRRTTQQKATTDGVGAEIDRVAAALDRLAEPLDLARPGAHGGVALDRRSVADFFDELGVDPAARPFVDHAVRDDYNVEPEQLSLLSYALDDKAAYNQPDSGVEAFRIRGGNDRLAMALRDRLGGRALHLHAPVTAIRQRSGRVTVVAGGERFRADRCVVAAPLPALRDVEFEPALPSAVADAIRDLQYGTGVKTLLQYRSRFWRSQGFSGDTITDLPVNATWEATDRQPGTPGILLCYGVGAPGAAYGRLAPADRVDAARSDVDRIYPGSAALFSKAATLAWHNEMYTGGAYTAYAPGQVTRFARALRFPIGRIQLAGEHTDARFPGYMEGAVRSGARVARAIARLGG